MRVKGWTIAVASVSAGLIASLALRAADLPSWKPTFDADGTAHVPAFDLPPSTFMSEEAAGLLKLRAQRPPGPFIPDGDIETIRRVTDERLAPAVQMTRNRYASVDMTEQTIADVPVRVFAPRDGEADRKQVLINLHGGGFTTCWNSCSILESQPIAAVGRYKVVSVDYRQGPEAVFPAASEDAATVYRALLETYESRNIGIYGCSAGGVLTGQTAAWLQTHGLPRPGALGVFGAGAGRSGTGDSSHISPRIDGSFPPPPPPGMPTTLPGRAYFEGADMSSPMVSPMLHLDVLAKFPPTLVITGTRALDLSPAVYTHSQLVKAGVPGDLIVGEGMGHCYIYFPGTPESQDAYDTIVKFFRRHLG